MAEQETIVIEARDLRPSDVWLGDKTELTVNGVRLESNWKFVPWAAAKNAPAVEMQAVQITGTLRRYNTWVDEHDKVLAEAYTGTWTLQADQPLEVRRG